MLDRQYLYFPGRWEDRNWRDFSGLPLEDVWFWTKDGVRLFGWYLPAPSSEVLLLWCHGNAGNIADRLENLELLYRHGLSTFIFDYRGYGRSAGAPSEEGLYEDALAAYDHLVTNKKTLPERIVAFGRSLGAPVAGELARKRQVAGLILETPFPSVAAVARRLFYGFPVHQLLRARFDLASRLKEIHTPVLVVHGDRDTTIPFALGWAVYEAANEPKEFYRIPGADHNDTYVVGGESYFQRLLEFIRRVT